jgi:hypothetical protein
MKPKEGIINLLEKTFESATKKSENNQGSRNKSIKQEINRIEREMENKLNTINKLSNITIINRMEEEWAILNQKKIDMEEQLNNKFLSEIELKDLYMRYKTIVSNPIAIWEMGNKELKTMLISVLFGGKIYYSKKLGFQTNENQAIFKDSPIYLYNLLLYGASDKTFLKPEEENANLFNQISTALLQHKDKITDFYTLVKYQAKFYPKIESFFSNQLLPLNGNRTIYK